MDWKDNFSSTILTRGKRYLTQGAVRTLERNGSAYHANVVGTEIYDVRIETGNGNIVHMDCTCPYGYNCKHEAAVLYAIERKYGKEAFEEAPTAERKKTTVKINPFRDPDDGIYRFFSIENITRKLNITEKAYKDALQLMDTGKATITGKYFTMDNQYHYLSQYDGLAGKIVVSINEGSNPWDVTEVRLSYLRNDIHEMKCSPGRSEACWKTDKDNWSSDPPKASLCKHKVAALILLERMLLKENPGDTTDKTGADILDFFSTKARKKNEPKKKVASALPVDIEPSLDNEGYGFYSFSARIGRDKYYVLKYLKEFTVSVDNGQVIQLGKSTTIDLSTAELSDRAEAAIAFIRKHCTSYSCNSIDLTGEALDDFYDTFKDTGAVLNRRTTLKFREKDPRLDLKITENQDPKGRFDGITVSGKAASGTAGRKSYVYNIEGDTLCRTDISKMGLAMMLSQKADRSGKITFKVGVNNIDAFFTRVLPELRKYGSVDESGLSKAYEVLRTKPHVVFYLDYVDESVTCRAEATYPLNTYSILPQETEAMKDDRNRIEEEDVRQALSSIFEYTDETSWRTDIDDYSVYNMLTNGIDFLLTLGEVQASNSMNKLKVTRMPQFSARMELRSGLLDLDVDTKGMTLEDILGILQSYKARKTYHRLRSGSFVVLENETLSTLKALFEDMHVSAKEFTEGKMHIPAYRALYLDAALENRENLKLDMDQGTRKLVKDFKTVKESDYEVPQSLRTVLRTYQEEGFRWLRTLYEYSFGGILADDMGLGKTVQMLTLLKSLKDEKKGGTALIVTPASVVYNWKAEANRFTPELRTETVAGKQKEREEIIARYSDYDIIITSYDLLKRDIALYEGKHFDVQIIDEGQFVKNHNTAASKAVRAIDSTHRFALTGTPIENRLLELWSIFDYLMPGFLFSGEYFRKNIENPIMKGSDSSAPVALKRMVGPFILRRLKSDVLKDLPDKLEEVRYCGIEGEQKKLYDAQVAHLKKTLEDQKKKKEDFQEKKLEVLAELTKIRQICCDPSLLYDDYNGPSAKREGVLDLLRSAMDGGHKVLLFSQFTTMLGLLEKDLEKEHISYYKITGETPKEKRLELVDAFNSDNVPVFLISLKAGGTGLNLTGADIVIHYDPWWNMAVQNQATDRAHRIGQQKVVSVFRMIVRDSIEEKILQLQERKRDLADEIVSTENVSLSSLTREDILEILGG